MLARASRKAYASRVVSARSAPTSEALHPNLPLTLSRLHRASEGAERDDAWAEFIAAHSAVVLHACRSTLRDHDAAMDAYAFVLQALRDNGCQRLRAYVPNATSRFETWLLVVARRLVLDYYRHRYGRSRSENESRRVDQLVRRSLEDLVGEEIDADQIEDAAARSPDASVRAQDLRRLLQRSIDELHPTDRFLLVLRFVDERPIREIARALDLPTVFHVYRRLAAVLSALRRALARGGVVGPDA